MTIQARSWALTALVGVAGLAILVARSPGEPALAGAQTETAAAAKAKAARFLSSPSMVRASHGFYREKARLELEILKAQIKAKQAEIERRDAESRIAELTPDLAILEKLDQPVPMKFAHETPFEDVLKYVKQATAGPDDHGIPIYVDPVALQQAEKTMTSPVTIDLEGVPLWTTLRLVLKQLGLGYTVEGGLLTIRSEGR
jgi:hypothetical protein